MIDMDEIMKWAQAASERASQQLNENIEKGRQIAEQMQADAEEATGEPAQPQVYEAQAAEPKHASQQRQVTILEQLFDEDNGNDVETNKGACNMETTDLAQVYNYVVVDQINGKPLKAYRVEKSKKRKGLLAPRVEIIFLEPGQHKITACGKTYQTSPTMITADLDAGKYYCLGADEDGLYIQERPYEWTLK